MLWQYTKRDAVKNFFPLPNEIFFSGSVLRRAGGLLLPALL